MAPRLPPTGTAAPTTADGSKRQLPGVPHLPQSKFLSQPTPLQQSQQATAAAAAAASNTSGGVSPRTFSTPSYQAHQGGGDAASMTPSSPGGGGGGHAHLHHHHHHHEQVSCRRRPTPLFSRSPPTQSPLGADHTQHLPRIHTLGRFHPLRRPSTRGRGSPTLCWRRN